MENNEYKVQAKIGLSKTDKEIMANDVYNRADAKITPQLNAMHETIQSLGGLKPSGVDTSTNILAFTYNKGIYVANDTGGWYYWKADVSKYVYGGVYQNDINTIDLGVVIYSSPLGSGKEYKVGVVRLIQRIEAYIEENNIGTRNLIFICKMQNDGQNIGIWTSFYNGENKEIYVNIYRDEENLIYHSHIDDDTGNRKNEEVVQKNIEIPDGSVTINKLDSNIQETFKNNFFTSKTISIGDGKWKNNEPLLKDIYVPITIIANELLLESFSFTITSTAETSATIYLLKNSQEIKSNALTLQAGTNNIEFEINKVLSTGEYQLKIITNSDVLNYPYLANGSYTDNYISTSGTSYVYNNTGIVYLGVITYSYLDTNSIYEEIKKEIPINMNYNNVIDTNENIMPLNKYNKWGNLFHSGYDVSATETTLTFPILENGNSGMESLVLPLTNSNMVYLEFDIDIGTYTNALNVFLKLVKSDNSEEYIILKAITKSGRYLINIDTAYFSVYKNAKEFTILFVGNENTSGILHTINITNYNCYQSDIRGLNIYDTNLTGIIKKIQNNIDIVSFNTNKEENYLVAPNGNKYIMQVNNNGSLSAVNIVPNKALFIGNSLLVGFGTFGMASSDNQHDYYYLVNKEIKKQNNNYSSSKMEGYTYEACTTETSQNEWITNTLTPALSNDLDLVIVQLGDNVNTEEKLAVFENGAIKLLQAIRNTCSNARVVWVGEWYSSSTKQQYIYNACSKTGSLFVDISDLSTSENQAKIGDVITYPDGTTTTITESGVASHPSNVGMEKIAKRILFKLGLIDSE